MLAPGEGRGRFCCRNQNEHLLSASIGCGLGDIRYTVRYGGMKNMNDRKFNIHQNLAYLRKSRQLSLEEVAERIGVSRQAVGKWEAGGSLR